VKLVDSSDSVQGPVDTVNMVMNPVKGWKLKKS
jgi:hypothetical protein